MEKLKNRLRSKTLWVSVAALILMVLKQFGVEIADAEYNQIVNGVLAVLILAGIIDGN